MGNTTEDLMRLIGWIVYLIAGIALLAGAAVLIAPDIANFLLPGDPSRQVLIGRMILVGGLALILLFRILRRYMPKSQ
jgi:hypothetical protein